MINIARLLFPSQIGTFKLASEKVLGVQLGETFVRACVLNRKTSRSIIEKIFEISCDKQAPLINAEGAIDEALLAKLLGQVYKQFGNVDKIIISLPANLFVFKELSVPFAQPEKINMILRFEAEALLPFSIENSALSFIKSPQETSGPSLINICATQQSMLQALKNVHAKLNVKPDAISVDLVAFYDLCNQLESWTDNSQNYAIISIAEFWTKIGIVNNGLLRFVKNIPQGASHIAQAVTAEQSQLSLEQIYDLMQKPQDMVLSNTEILPLLDKQYLELCNKIQFSLQSFISKQETALQLDKIIFLEERCPLPGLIKICQQQINAPCQNFSVDKLLGPNKIVNRASFQASAIYSSAVALGCAAVSENLSNFDLGKPNISKSIHDLLKQQLIASLFIICVVFGYVFVTNNFKEKELSELIKTTDQSIKDQLTQNIFIDQKPPRNTTIAKLVSSAEETVNSMQLSWNKHNNDDLKPLEVVLDLTRIIDRTKIDLQINSVRLFYDEMAKKMLEIQGSVPKAAGDKELEKLTAQLSSLKKFANIEVSKELVGQEVLFKIQTLLEL